MCDYRQECTERQMIAAGDQELFANWLARNEDRLRLSLVKFARQVDVETVVQETALRIWQVAGRIEPDGKPGFMIRCAIRIARNLAIDLVRRAGHEVPLEPEDDPPASAQAGPGDPLFLRRLRECFKGLPPRPSEAMTMRLNGRGTASDRQLAELAGMSFDAFRRNLSRARRLLEKCLQLKGINVREWL